MKQRRRPRQRHQRQAQRPPPLHQRRQPPPQNGEGAAKALARAARTAARQRRVEKLKAQAWRLANRFGYVLDVEPADVFDPTRGQAPVETVRHLVAHVLMEIDKARPTDLDEAMRRDRSTLRNSFKRAWDLREDRDVERLILMVADTRGLRFGAFKRIAAPGRAAFALALSPTGRGGRHRPEDFQHALRQAAQAMEMPARLEAAADAPRPPAPTPAAALPPAAAILDASPLTRRLLREPSIEAEPTMTGGLRLAVRGYALKGGMREISAQLAKVLEAAGFVVTEDGVFEVPGKKSFTAKLRVAAAGALAGLILLAGGASETPREFLTTEAV